MEETGCWAHLLEALEQRMSQRREREGVIELGHFGKHGMIMASRLVMASARASLILFRVSSSNRLFFVEGWIEGKG